MSEGRRIKTLASAVRDVPLDTYFKWAQIFALVATPFLVALVGALATWTSKQSEVAVKYVELASDILKPEPDATNGHQRELRKWACGLLNAHARIPVQLDACIGAPLIADSEGDSYPPTKPSTDRKHCDVHLPVGLPGSDGSILCRETYAFSYNKDAGAANWVAYRMGGLHMPRDVPRVSKFFLDPDLKAAKMPGARVYANNEWDRGHLVRRVDAGWAQSGGIEVNYYSVVVPQHAESNQGVWYEIEDLATEAVRKGKVQDLWVVSGPIYLGGNGLYRGVIPIPDKLFRIYFDLIAKRVVAFVVPNDGGVVQYKGRPEKLIVALSEIERQTGLSFLSKVALQPIELRRLKDELGNIDWLRD